MATSGSHFRKQEWRSSPTSGNLLITADSLALSISIVICVLAAFRALNSRKVLTTPLYRTRALWTGTAAMVIALLDAWGIVLENTGASVTFGIVPPYGTPEFYIFVILTAAAGAVVFAWIDSTVRVALELDFTHRDAVKWKSLRPAAGVAFVGGIIIAQFATIDWEVLLSIVLLAPASAYMAAALVAAGSRVRNVTMRSYIKWMGFLVASLILLFGTNVISAYLNFPLAISAYFLYRISSSLLKTTPINLAVAESPSSDSRPGAVPNQGPMQAPR